MLGSVARKLRIFGYDALYFKEGGDVELQAMAKRTGRIVLTSDLVLFERLQKHGKQSFLVQGNSDRQRLLSLLRSAGPGLELRLGGRNASRCAVCNGELEVATKKVAHEGGVPSKVLARHRLFFRCTSCGRFYWRGKHWGRLRRLSYSLKTKDLT